MKPLPRSLLALLALLLGACASTPPAIEGGRLSSFDGVELAYDAGGSGDTSLLFVHGWCCSRRQWARTMDVFAENYRVVALDLAGHGDSEKGRETWDLPSFSRDVVAVIEGLDLDRVVLVGHSMGGPVCLGAAAAVPERVVGVIGVDTLHDAEMKFDAEAMRPFIEMFEKDFEGTAAGFVESMLPASADPSVLETIMSDVRRAGAKVGTAVMRSYVGFAPDECFAACPVPLVCINAATPNPTEVEHNRAHVPDFEVLLMEGVGHFLVLEAPEAFEQRLREAIALVRGLAAARD